MKLASPDLSPPAAPRRVVTVAWRALGVPCLAIGYWSGIEIWGQVLNRLNGVAPREAMLAGQVAGVLGAAAISVVSYLLIRATSPAPLVRRLVFGGLTALAGSSAYALHMIALGQVVPVARPPGAVGLAHFAWEMLFFLPPFALATAFVLILDSGRQMRERDSRLAAALIHAREAEVRALHYQVNPHFLYNALNSLSTLILDGRGAEADQMVHRLAAFFRSNLTADPLSDVPLAAELDQQRLYLSLEEIRYRGRLEVRFDVPEELEAALTPSLILQPLVENAIKHGVHEPGGVTTISITARAAQGLLRLEVRDNGPSAPDGASAGTGVGLANVRQRLLARFGEQAAFRAGPDPAGGFMAQILMPLYTGPAGSDAEFQHRTIASC